MLLAMKMFLFIPEPVELFASGVALVSGAGMLRWLLNRVNVEKADEEVTEDGL